MRSKLAKLAMSLALALTATETFADCYPNFRVCAEAQGASCYFARGDGYYFVAGSEYRGGYPNRNSCLTVNLGYLRRSCIWTRGEGYCAY